MSFDLAAIQFRGSGSTQNTFSTTPALLPLGQLLRQKQERMTISGPIAFDRGPWANNDATSKKNRRVIS